MDGASSANKLPWHWQPAGSSFKARCGRTLLYIRPTASLSQLAAHLGRSHGGVWPAAASGRAPMTSTDVLPAQHTMESICIPSATVVVGGRCNLPRDESGRASSVSSQGRPVLGLEAVQDRSRV